MLAKCKADTKPAAAAAAPAAAAAAAAAAPLGPPPLPPPACLSQSDIWGCSKCRWSKAGCLQCNPDKVTNRLAGVTCKKEKV